MAEELSSHANKSAAAMRIAVEGCGHGTLDAIYASIQKSCEIKGWDGIDLVIICGDFQAVRDQHDLNVTAMPAKYRRMADFHQYYWGVKTAPYLTIFVGGNHEASNHLFELYYGGWVAPNIYYMGAANVIQVGPLKIAGMSGIWKGYDYRRSHFERLPYSQDDMYSIYHVRELDVRKLLSFRSQIDIGISHDWPKGIEWLGDHEQLFKHKPHLREDAQSKKLGNTAAQQVMDRLRPPYWFSAHLHTKYAAVKSYAAEKQVSNEGTKSSKSDITKDQAQSTVPRASAHQEQISAWNNFGARARKEEAEETARIVQEEQTRREAAERTGAPVTANYILNETYKQVRLGNGFQRDVTTVNNNEDQSIGQENQQPIPQLDGCCASLPMKRRREPSSSPKIDSLQSTGYTSIADAEPHTPAMALTSNVTGTNPDAIDIDMSDDETTQLTADVDSSVTQTLDLPVVPTSIEDPEQDNPTSAPTKQDRPNTISNEVSQGVREQLAALSSKFEEPIQASAPLPHPVSIKNETTKFLALSKCEDKQNFLQMLEVQSYDAARTPTNRPVKLQYVPEWLAILRVFASELSVGGGPNDQAPQHRGDTYYHQRILEEEKWVQEHIADAGCLEIPENFVTMETGSGSDSAVSDGGMPREITNPQTVAFCRLVDIENPFHISEEERDARMAKGPAESSNTGSRGRDNSGNRGGHRGRGGNWKGGRHRGNRGWGGRGGSR